MWSFCWFLIGCLIGMATLLFYLLCKRLLRTEHEHTLALTLEAQGFRLCPLCLQKGHLPSEDDAPTPWVVCYRCSGLGWIKVIELAEVP